MGREKAYHGGARGARGGSGRSRWSRGLSGSGSRCCGGTLLGRGRWHRSLDSRFRRRSGRGRGRCWDRGRLAWRSACLCRCWRCRGSRHSSRRESQLLTYQQMSTRDAPSVWLDPDLPWQKDPARKAWTWTSVAPHPFWPQSRMPNPKLALEHRQAASSALTQPYWANWPLTWSVHVGCCNVSGQKLLNLVNIWIDLLHRPVYPGRQHHPRKTD